MGVLSTFKSAIGWGASFFTKSQQTLGDYLHRHDSVLYGKIVAKCNDPNSSVGGQLSAMIDDCKIFHAQKNYADLHITIARIERLLSEAALPVQPRAAAEPIEQRKDKKGTSNSSANDLALITTHSAPLSTGTSDINTPGNNANQLALGLSSLEQDLALSRSNLDKALYRSTGPDTQSYTPGSCNSTWIGDKAGQHMTDINRSRDWRDVQIAEGREETRRKKIDADTDVVNTLADQHGKMFGHYCDLKKKIVKLQADVVKHNTSEAVKDRQNQREHDWKMDVGVQNQRNEHTLKMIETSQNHHYKMNETSQGHHYQMALLMYAFGYGGSIALIAALSFHYWLLPSQIGSAINAVMLPLLVFTGIAFSLAKAHGGIPKVIADYLHLGDVKAGNSANGHESPIVELPSEDENTADV